jgi:hypothetical protein
MDAPEALTVALMECTVCCKTFVPADAASGRAVCSHCGAHNFEPAPGAEHLPHGAAGAGAAPLAFGWFCDGAAPGYPLIRH